jgi:hypothetical protein
VFLRSPLRDRRALRGNREGKQRWMGHLPSRTQERAGRYGLYFKRRKWPNLEAFGLFDET